MGASGSPLKSPRRTGGSAGVGKEIIHPVKPADVLFI